MKSAPNRIRSIVILPVLGLLLSFAVAGYFGKSFIDDVYSTAAQIRLTDELVDPILLARLRLSEAQLAAQKYLKQRDEQLIAIARNAAEAAGQELDKARAAVSAHPEFEGAGQLLQLMGLFETALGTTRHVLDLAESGDNEAASSAIHGGLDTDKQLQVQVLTLLDGEVDGFIDKQTDLVNTLWRVVWLLIGMSVLAAACGAAAIWALARQVAQSQRRYEALDRANRTLAESRAQMQAVLDSAHDPILVVDGDGVVELANQACGKAFGVVGGSLAGTDVSELVPALAGGAQPTGEVQVTRRDGSGFPAEISTGVFEREGRDISVCILRDVTERHRLDLLKNEFVSTVSHELRTPLTSIRGSLGLITAGAAGTLPDKAKGLLEIAHKNSERLVGLVNDILDIEKIESGRLEFRRDRLEATALVEQAVEANQAYAAQHQVDYRIDIRPGAALPVLGDADRLIQVLTNLLSNAAKFSPAGTSVEVTVEAAGPQVRIGVRDHGAGIPEAFRNRIFQRFAQAEGNDSRQKGGTGLGLSIAKAIVERHGGRIGFEAADGGGTRFWFTLPLVAEPPATPVEPVSHDTRRRVLVCEDDPDVATLLSMMIERDGWRVDVAQDGETALAKATANRYEAMTVDLHLPGMDGLTLIRRLRADPATADLPMVVVSAIATAGKRELNGDAVNIVDWLDKPIEQLRLRAALRQAGLRSRDGRARILHVEDDDDVIEVVGAIVRDEAEIIPARSLTEARLRLAEQRFDLVIIDVGLPDGSGLDLLETINARMPREPVLIFSAQDSNGSFASAVSASLVKSRTDNEQLHQTITALINGLADGKQEGPRHGR